MATHQPPKVKPIPPLENGDRLNRAEFERRYHAMSHVKKAELIDGVVHMPSPVRFRHHSSPQHTLVGWSFLYSHVTPGVGGGDNGTTRLDVINEPQPDVMLLILPEYGGQARISADDYIEHAPELVAEVSASTVSIDLNKKFEVYRRCGVREYIVWRVEDGEIDWFVLRDEEYVRLLPGDDGITRSEAFPGLWLDTRALAQGDVRRVAEVAHLGTCSAEHSAFVAALAARREA